LLHYYRHLTQGTSGFMSFARFHFYFFFSYSSPMAVEKR